MSEAVAAPRARLSTWYGWVIIGTLALVPVVGWAVPMGFAVLIGLAGLLCLPALRITDEDRPALVALLVLLVWAAMSTAWSPYRPSKPGNMTALKLALELPLYWAFVSGARRMDPGLRSTALRALAWGSALLGLLLLMEFVADARVLEQLHLKFLGPIRHDISQVHIGHSSFVMALLWPLGLAAAVRSRASPWLMLPMVAGTLLAALRFGSDAPVISLGLAILVGAAAWRWPSAGPKALAWAAVVYVLSAPALIWAVRATGQYGGIERSLPLSWSERMAFWSHAIDWMRDHPLRGWGLDASRMFGPGIILHPHDDALQLWLELGAVGAILGAAFFFLAIRRLARPRPDFAVACLAASAAVYLLFGALNFGVWQEWWLALGALVAASAALLAPGDAAKAST